MHVDFNLAQSGNVSLRVFDLMGRAVLTKNYGNKAKGKVSLLTNVSSLSAGTYVVAVQTPTGLVARQFVVTK